MSRFSKRFDPDLMLILVLLGFGLVAYSNSFSASFHFDDIPNILENDALRDLASLGGIYSRCEERFLTFLTMAVNYRISKFDPVGYHIFNFFIHYFATLFLYFLSLEIWKTPAMKGLDLHFSKRLTALLAAGIFLLHPLQTQSVTYIIQRAESMAGMFYLGAIFFYIKARLCQPGRAAGGFYTLMILCGLGSAFSKETAVTLPVMVVICELLLFETSVKDLCRQKVVILLFIPAGLIVAYKFGSLIRTDFFYDSEPGQHFTRKQYLLTQFSVLLTYLRLFFWPAGQNLDWDYPVAVTLFNGRTVLSLLLLLTLIFVALFLYRRQPLISLGIVAFFVTLAPTSSIIPIKDLIYEHRMYLAVAFLAMGCVHLLLQGLEKIKGMFPRCCQVAFIGVIVTVLPLLSTLTYARNEVWQSELSLWQDAAQKSPNKARVHLNYGRALYLFGLADIREAKKEFETANRLCPSCPDPYHNLAFVYLKEGDYRKALALDLEAIKRKPNHRDALYQLGKIYKELRQWQDARIYWERLFSLPPSSKYLPVYVDLIGVYREMGLHGEADNLTRKLITMPYTSPHLDYYRGMAFYKMKDFTRAKTYFEKQTKGDSKRVRSYLMLGQIHYEEMNFPMAERAFRQAVGEQTWSAAAHYNLALILEKRGNFQEAIEHLKKAKATDPFSLGDSLYLIKLYGYLGHSSEQYELVRVLLDLRPDSTEFSFIKANGDQNLNAALRGYLQMFVSGDPSPPAERIRAIVAVLREDYPEAIEHFNRYLESVTDEGERGRVKKELYRLEALSDGRVPLVMPL